jgi:hypothetical protein
VIHTAYPSAGLVEMHELLHGFIFNHIDNEESIMYPFASKIEFCSIGDDKKIRICNGFDGLNLVGEDIINDLKKVYGDNVPKGTSYELSLGESGESVYYQCYEDDWSFSLDNEGWNLINRDNVINKSRSSESFKGSDAQIALSLESKSCDEGLSLLKNSEAFVKSYKL